jgi:hypothetical protein
VRGFAILLIVVGGLIFGCAHSHDKFYLPDGQLCAEIKSTVLGTGETEKYVVVNPCGVTESYDTKDTGISDNATELGGNIAEGLAKGAAKGLVPVP